MKTRNEVFDDIMREWVSRGLIDQRKYHNEPIYHAYIHRLIQTAVDAIYPELQSAFYRGRNSGCR